MTSSSFEWEGYAGWYTGEELGHLYQAAKNAPPGAFVEVGVYHGRSAQALVIAAGSERNVYLIDPAVDESVVKRYADKPNVHVIRAKGIEVPAPEQIAVLHIDDNHEYETTSGNVRHFAPHVVIGGYIVLHDYNVDDVFRAMGNWLKEVGRDPENWGGGSHLQHLFRM